MTEAEEAMKAAILVEMERGAPHLGIARDRVLAARIPEAERCERCLGSGNEFYSMYRRCSACDGTGRAESPVSRGNE